MSLTPWQRTNILNALNYLKEIARTSEDVRGELLARGLHEVLDPSRRVIRLQREAAQSTTPEIKAARERRSSRDRRGSVDRRKTQVPIDFPDRRSGGDRRSGNRRGSSE